MKGGRSGTKKTPILLNKYSYITKSMVFYWCFIIKQFRAKFYAKNIGGKSFRHADYSYFLLLPDEIAGTGVTPTQGYRYRKQMF